MTDKKWNYSLYSSHFFFFFGFDFCIPMCMVSCLRMHLKTRRPIINNYNACITRIINSPCWQLKINNLLSSLLFCSSDFLFFAINCPLSFSTRCCDLWFILVFSLLLLFTFIYCSSWKKYSIENHNFRSLP